MVDLEPLFIEGRARLLAAMKSAFVGIENAAVVTRQAFQAHASELLDYAATRQSVIVLGKDDRTWIIVCRQF